MSHMVGVFFALGSARFTGFGANLHVRLHKLRPTGRQSAAERADVGTVAAEFNAGGHVVTFAVFIAHFQQSRYAAFAGFRTVKARIRVVVFVLHRFHRSLILVSNQRWSTNVTDHVPFRFYRIPGYWLHSQCIQAAPVGLGGFAELTRCLTDDLPKLIRQVLNAAVTQSPRHFAEGHFPVPQPLLYLLDL